MTPFRVEVDEDTESGMWTGVVLDTTTRLSNSVALRLVLAAVSTPEHELEVVMEGSVAQARSSRGLRWLLLRGRGEDSRQTRRRFSAVAIVVILRSYTPCAVRVCTYVPM